jgi:hypothetical protein
MNKILEIVPCLSLKKSQQHFEGCNVFVLRWKRDGTKTPLMGSLKKIIVKP